MMPAPVAAPTTPCRWVARGGRRRGMGAPPGNTPAPASSPSRAHNPTTQRTLYRPLTSSSRRSSCAALLPLPRGGKLGALLLALALLPLLLPVARPACIRTFMVSRGWIVLCEAARAMAPATTSCAGLPSGCGGGGGGGGATTAGAVTTAVPLVEAAAAETALPSLPVGCVKGGDRAGGGGVRRAHWAGGTLAAAQANRGGSWAAAGTSARGLTCPRPVPMVPPSALRSTRVTPAPVAAVTTPCGSARGAAAAGRLVGAAGERELVLRPHPPLRRVHGGCWGQSRRGVGRGGAQRQGAETLMQSTDDDRVQRLWLGPVPRPAPRAG